MDKSLFPVKMFFTCVGLGMLAYVLSLPFPPRFEYLAIGFLALAGAVGLGLILQDRLGLPLGRAESGGTDAPANTAVQQLVLGTAWGAGLGFGMAALLRYVLFPALPLLRTRFLDELDTSLWRRIILAFDAAVLEELLFRLFLFSLVAWGITRFSSRINEIPHVGLLWAVTVLIAIGFGMAHLGRWTNITRLTPALAMTVVFLNTCGGVVFGFLYFSEGIWAAMAAHFVADFVLHGVGLPWMLAQ